MVSYPSYSATSEKSLYAHANRFRSKSVAKITLS